MSKNEKNFCATCGEDITSTGKFQIPMPNNDDEIIDVCSNCIKRILMGWSPKINFKNKIKNANQNR